MLLIPSGSQVIIPGVLFVYRSRSRTIATHADGSGGQGPDSEDEDDEG